MPFCPLPASEISCETVCAKNCSFSKDIFPYVLAPAFLILLCQKHFLSYYCCLFFLQGAVKRSIAMKAGQCQLLVQTPLGFPFRSMNFRSARLAQLILVPDYHNGPLNQATQCFAAR